MIVRMITDKTMETGVVRIQEEELIVRHEKKDIELAFFQ